MSDVRILVAAGLLTLVIAFAGAIVSPPEGPAAVAPSSFSASPAGGKAAYTTLKELGYSVERSFEPLTALRVNPAEAALLITGPVGPSDQDRRALQAFLDAGGVALVVGIPGAMFLGLEDIGRDDWSASPAVTHRSIAASPLAAGAEEITMAAGPELTLDPPFVAVFAQPETRPLVATAKIGAGHAIWLAAPTPFANEHIRSADNLQLLLNVVGRPGERVVVWDEHYHGYTRSLWSYAAGTPLPWIGAQTLLLALAAFAVFSRRSGPVRPRAVDPRTSPLEFIDMLQALYRRADAAPAAIGAALARFRRALMTAAGVPLAAGDDVAARSAAAMLSTEAREIQDLLAAGRLAAADPNIGTGRAVKITAALQELTARLQRGR